jgi:hypothetical protein
VSNFKFPPPRFCPPFEDPTPDSMDVVAMGGSIVSVGMFEWIVGAVGTFGDSELRATIVQEIEGVGECVSCHLHLSPLC